MLHGIAERDCSQHKQGFPTDDIYVAPVTRIEHSALYAVMGDDGAAGSIEIDGDSTIADRDRDGIARIRWDKCKNLPVFDAQVKTLAGLTKRTGGRVIPNPVWKTASGGTDLVLKDQRGPAHNRASARRLHNGDTGSTGVVDDHWPRVFE